MKFSYRNIEALKYGVFLNFHGSKYIQNIKTPAIEVLSSHT